MYLRITRGHFAPAAYEQIALLPPEVSAAVARLPGLQHQFHGIDRTTGTIAVVSVWDTEEHARFSRDALGEVLTRATAAGVHLDPPDFYELSDPGGTS